MPKKTIEEVVTTEVNETVEETVVFCDHCTEEADEYVTLSNVSAQCLDEALEHANNGGSLDQQIKRLRDNAEQFYACPGCQKGLREHGRTIDTALYDAPEEDETDSRVGSMSKFDLYVTGSTMLLVAFLFVGGIVVSFVNPVGGIGMVVIGVALILALLVDPPENA